MTSIQKNNSTEYRISVRIKILSELENLINESVYYRTNSENFKIPKIVIGNILNSEIKSKIL